LAKSPKFRQQFAAVPLRAGAHGVEVLLVTSRGTGRWIVPKGWPMEDKRPHRVAEIEAYEEAGVAGKARKKAAGRYDYLKDGAVPCRVTVFALPVAGLLDVWPEDRERQRRWFPAADAAQLVEEPELRRIILELAASPKALPQAGDMVAPLSKRKRHRRAADAEPETG